MQRKGTLIISIFSINARLTVNKNFCFLSANCSAGLYPDPSNTSVCIPCDVGFYKDVHGAMLCMQCPTDYSTAAFGSDAASLCHGM